MRKVSRNNSNDLLLESVIGKTLDQANHLAGFSGFTIRVVRENGESYMITADLKLTRINVEIENGLVIKSYLG